VREDATGAFRPITSSLRTGWDTLLPLGKQYVNLEPGRYTVRMNDTAALRGDVRLDGDHRKGVIDLELLQRAFVSGRVVLPAGHSFGDVRVRMEGDRQDPGGVGGGMFHGLAAPQPGVFPVNPDGTFHIPVPGDRPVRLVPYHPALSAAPDGGSVTTREGRTGVVLRLEAAGLITFRLPTSFPMPKLGASDRNVRILLFPGGPSGKPTFHGWAVAGKGGYRIGGWRPGTATIWIDVPGSVPIILRDQELPAEGLDFGELPVRAGTRVHVRWLAAKDKLDFWKGVDIERIDGPHFRRSNSPMDTLWKPGVESGEVITVSGLSAGRYRLLTTQKGGPQAVRHLDEIIEVDGESDLWRTVEFR